MSEDASRQDGWDARLRFRPSAEAVRRLKASHGDAAVRERWGAYAANLIRSAPERPLRGRWPKGTHRVRTPAP